MINIRLKLVKPLIKALTGLIPPFAAELNPSSLEVAFFAPDATDLKPLASFDTPAPRRCTAAPPIALLIAQKADAVFCAAVPSADRIGDAPPTLCIDICASALACCTPCSLSSRVVMTLDKF